MPQAPPLSWPEPPAPPPPTPPPRDRDTWVPLAIIGGAAVLVALVATLVTVVPADDRATAPPDVGAPTSAAIDAGSGGPPASRPVASLPPPVTVPPSTSTSAPAPRSGWPVDLSPAALQAALLTGADLAMGEDVGPPPDTTDTIPVEDLEADVACQEALRRYDAIGFRPLFGGGPPRAPRRATVELAGRGATVEHELGDGLEVTIADIRDLFETCTEVGFTTTSGSGRLSIRSAPPVAAGDDSLSLEYTFSMGGAAAPPIHWVLWERSSIISSVSVSGAEDGARPLLEDAVEIADLRLEEVIG